MSKNTQLSSDWTPFTLAAVLGTTILLVVFIVASINLVRVAIVSQPACVTHDRMGGHESSAALAAKSSC
ncbi:MAG: hypothetical protein AB8B87_00085 [Granulosicoccus sp.]